MMDCTFNLSLMAFRAFLFVNRIPGMVYASIDLVSRNNNPLAIDPILRDSLRELPDGIYDGELMLHKFNESWHQSRFVIFDLLRLDNTDTYNLPYRSRVTMIYAAMVYGNSRNVMHYVHMAPHHINANSAKTEWYDTCKCTTNGHTFQLDGVVAKPANASYLFGKRAQFKLKPTQFTDR